jgi:transposase-like protein
LPKPKDAGIRKPTCQDCGTDDAVELINFTDRDTGEAKARFKCADCNKWLGKAFVGAA